MELARRYDQVFFSAEVLREAAAQFRKNHAGVEDPSWGSSLLIESDADRWTHDDEQEFFADYRLRPIGATYLLTVVEGPLEDRPLFFLAVRWADEEGGFSLVSTSARSRSEILRMFDVFERNKDACKLPDPPPQPKPKPVVFIGHGHSAQWKDLKDHLHEQHGYEVEAFETGARAGHTIRDVLRQMAKRSAFAVLVMTGEDDAGGELRARQNVVHECGLFQGRLGWQRTVVLLEEGTAPFSNLDGIQWIPFAKGRIAETFGPVLATLRREFGANP